jgi:hypothetical protein
LYVNHGNECEKDDCQIVDHLLDSLARFVGFVPFGKSTVSRRRRSAFGFRNSCASLRAPELLDNLNSDNIFKNPFKENEL